MGSEDEGDSHMPANCKALCAAVDAELQQETAHHLRQLLPLVPTVPGDMAVLR